MNEPKFTHDWFSPNIPHLEKHLAPLKDKNIIALEIGCYEGKASIWLLENILTHQQSLLWAIDTFEGSQEHSELGIDFSGVEDRCRWNLEQGDSGFRRRIEVIKIDSASWLREIHKSPRTRMCDLIYIDGSHTASDVLADSVGSWQALNPGGFIVWDDYGWDKYPDATKNPRLAIDSFLAVYTGQYELVYKGYQVIVKKN